MSIRPRWARRRRAASRVASLRDSGRTVVRSSSSCWRLALRKSMRSLPGRTACRVTTSRPRCSAVRRRASDATMARNRSMLRRTSSRSSRSVTCGVADCSPCPGPGRRRGPPAPARATSGAEPLERLVRRPAAGRAAALAHLPEQVDGDLGHLLEGAGVVVGQGHREQVAQVVDVQVVVGVEHGLRGAGAGREVQVERHVEDVALAAASHQRRRQPLAQQLAPVEAEHLHDGRGIDGLAGPGGDALACAARRRTRPDGRPGRHGCPRAVVLMTVTGPRRGRGCCGPSPRRRRA